jgi:hypothetical protein
VFRDSANERSSMLDRFFRLWPSVRDDMLQIYCCCRHLLRRPILDSRLMVLQLHLT